MNAKRKKLLRLSAVQFATWEFHMYLDTHPGDTEAAARYSELEAQYRQLLSDYESEYGPLMMPANGNSWLEGPWPWENTKEGNN